MLRFAPPPPPCRPTALSQPVFNVPDVPSRWRWLWWSLPPVLLLAALVASIIWQARHVAERSLQLAFGTAEVRHGGIGLDASGAVKVYAIEVLPADWPGDEPIRAAEMHITGPRWSWYLGNLGHLDRSRDTLRFLSLRLRDLQTPAGLDPSLGGLGPFALAASPFEAEGCVGRRHWSPNDLQAMELEAGARELELSWTVQASTLQQRTRYHAPGLSSVLQQRDLILPKPINALFADQYPSLLAAASWQIEDEGFIRARNRYCAKRERSDQRSVVDRHVQVVERILAADGIALDPGSRQSYRSFARDGGPLNITFRFDTPVAGDRIEQPFGSLEELRAAQTTLQFGEVSQALSWSPVPARPFPGWYAGKPGLDLLRQEQLGVATAESEPALPVPRKQAVVLEMAAIGELSREALQQALQLSSGRPPAAADPAQAATAPSAASSTPAPPTPADTGATVTPAPSAPVPAPAAAPTQAEINARPDHIERLAAPPPPPRPAGIRWEQLPDYIGRRIRIDTEAGGSRVVDLVAADGEELLVRARLGGGLAEFRIRREGFKEARLVQ